jgi:hypothetical protein
MGHRDRSRFGGEELGGQDPLPASRSCHGNHEGKEGMEWKVSRESLITMGWLPTSQTLIILINYDIIIITHVCTQ